MAYADPQSLTIGSTATPFARKGLSETSGTFVSEDTEYELSFAHNSSKRYRHVAKLTHRDIVSNPLVPSQNMEVSYGVHLVVDFPRQGVTAADAAALAKTLVAWATPANIVKLLAGES